MVTNTQLQDLWEFKINGNLEKQPKNNLSTPSWKHHLCALGILHASCNSLKTAISAVRISAFLHKLIGLCVFFLIAF